MNFVLEENGIVARCRECGTRNRLLYAKLGNETRCGKCKTALLIDAPIDLNSPGDFGWVTGLSAIPVLVDFWAPWCGPCKAVAPEVAKVAASSQGEFLVGKLNTEAVPQIAGRYNIASIPTMAVFHGGNEVARISGARPASAILEFVRQTLANA
jgi:thioredoxin 2